MFERKITEDLSLKITIPYYSSEIFELVNASWDHLFEWLPWVRYTETKEDTLHFIKEQIKMFSNSEALCCTIFYQNQIAGIVGFNSIDSSALSGVIGYWLGEQYQGKGLMTLSVQELMDVGVEFYGLKRFEIHCATDNKKSRSIPERLGFSLEGILKDAEKHEDFYKDLAVYYLNV